MFDRIGEALSSLDDFLALKRPLAADSAADEDDVLAAKKNLKRSGYYDEPDYGLTPYPDKPLFDGIRAFQKDNDLTVDGVMNPGGETETALNRNRVAQSDPLEGRAQDEHIMRRFIQARNNAPAQSTSYESAPPVPQRKPEAIAPTPKGNQLLDLIGRLESSDNYNIIYGNEEKPLTKMTIKEIQKLQQKMSDSGKASTAVGRYQIIEKKMNDLIKWMNVGENEIFDENLQDKMGRELMRRRGFEKFKTSKISTKDFIKLLSQEWAAFPKDESNESYYKGVGNNKALIDFETLKEILEKE